MYHGNTGTHVASCALGVWKEKKRKTAPSTPSIKFKINIDKWDIF